MDGGGQTGSHGAVTGTRNRVSNTVVTARGGRWVLELSGDHVVSYVIV